MRRRRYTWTNVRVVVQNLWGLRGDWQSRRAVIAAGLRELAPDLVAFVEAIKTSEYDQATDLLGSEYHLFHAATRHDNGDGAVIATRWRLGERHEVDLHVTPRTADFACTTLVAEVLAPQPHAPLLFANHMPNWQLQFERERELQAVAAARVLEELAGSFDTHVVLAGDLTADPDAASVRFFTGRQSLEGTSVCYRDAWESMHPNERGETLLLEGETDELETAGLAALTDEVCVVRAQVGGQPSDLFVSGPQDLLLLIHLSVQRLAREVRSSRVKRMVLR